MLIEVMPTGVLYSNTSKNEEYEKYRYNVIAGRELIYQETQDGLEKLKPKNGWQKTNEPEEHLDEIAEKIIREIEPKRILCFSYKDKSLAARIMKNCESEVITIYDTKGSLAMKHAEDAIDIPKEIEELVISDSFDLIIWRHYMEHFENYDVIFDIISKKGKKKSVIYLEVPDCEEFIKRGVPIFLWEQHKVYFEKSSIEKAVECSGIKDYKVYKYGESIEPSLCILCKKAESEKQKKQIIKDKDIDRQYELDSLIKSYTKRWRTYIEKENRPIYIIGAGHNSDRFIQMTGIGSKITCIIEDDEDKTGLYMGSNKIEIKNTNTLRDNSSLVIIGTHDRSVERIRKRIKRINCKIEIKTIYEVPNE